MENKPIRNSYKKQNEILKTALFDLLQLYVRLVESGDAGNWDAEKDQEVINARKALNQ